MNIFFLSACPSEAAAMLCNSHLNCMQKETAQLISTAFSHSSLCNHQVVLEADWADLAGLANKPTHKSHPSAIWTRSSNPNLSWLLKYAHSMNEEWLLRKRLRGLPDHQIVPHRSYEVSWRLGEFLLRNCNQVDKYTRRSASGNKLSLDPTLPTEVPLCMPEELWPGSKFVQSIADAVPYYRAYYKLHKRHIATWPESRTPDWWQSYCHVTAP